MWKKRFKGVEAYTKVQRGKGAEAQSGREGSKGPMYLGRDFLGEYPRFFVCGSGPQCNGRHHIYIIIAEPRRHPG